MCYVYDVTIPLLILEFIFTVLLCFAQKQQQQQQVDK